MQGSHVCTHTRQMRLPMFPFLNKNSLCFDKEMSPSNTYSIKLPYLGVIFSGKSPFNLTSFQKPLRELYIPYYHQQSCDECRIVISDSDLLIYQSDTAVKKKRTFIYSNFESVVDIQILKLSIMIDRQDKNQHHKPMQAAFLPIGCEHQERFRSLYSIINQTQYNHLANSTAAHPPLLLFVIRKPGVSESCSLLDCHVFAVHRELTAFEVCDMIRKLIIKRTMSPILAKKRTFICNEDKNKQISTMKHRQANNHLLSKVKLNDVVHTPRNPLSSSSILRNHIQHSSASSDDTSKVLTMNSDVHCMSSPCSSSKPRHFIKASTLIPDESDEIVNELMNIVAIEQLKTQGSIKRHASSEQISYSDDYIMNKKRYFHNKKRLLNPIPTINNNLHQPKINPRIGGYLLRPEIVLNRYGDIGNYVPKFLRENITMRSSDSNENIFFRSTHGQLLNGFLQLDILATKSTQENHSQSIPCLNQINSAVNINRISNLDDKTELPVDYRQYLRHTDQSVYLYGEKQCQQTTLEHSLGYFP